MQKEKKETAEGDPSNVDTQPSVDLVDILYLMYFKASKYRLFHFGSTFFAFGAFDFCSA